MRTDPDAAMPKPAGAYVVLALLLTALSAAAQTPNVVRYTPTEKDLKYTFGVAEPVARVVDTTGAGDQFAAGFLYGLTHGQPLDRCGRLGAAAAAEVISHYGARPETSLSNFL